MFEKNILHVRGKHRYQSWLGPCQECTDEKLRQAAKKVIDASMTDDLRFVFCLQTDDEETKRLRIAISELMEFFADRKRMEHDIDSDCPRCQGSGEVTTADYESYFGQNYKPCPMCGGSGDR